MLHGLDMLINELLVTLLWLKMNLGQKIGNKHEYYFLHGNTEHVPHALKWFY